MLDVGNPPTHAPNTHTHTHKKNNGYPGTQAPETSTVPAAHTHPHLSLSFNHSTIAPLSTNHCIPNLQRPAKQATLFRPVFGRSNRRSCKEKSDPGT
ncbi:uncharacterized protein CTRU02_209813 [Colletotrichum truncatum]|uniref:Uncharacterized protein n=1 Tax=Colletotrichum truncatum TaxID=5467 RepID=A0ACC3YVR8_COLTU